MIEDQAPHVLFQKVAPIGIEDGCIEGEQPGHSGRVCGPIVWIDDHFGPHASERRSDGIPTNRVPRADGGERVDSGIERCTPERTGPELGRRVEHEPNDIPVLAFELFDHQLTTSGRRLPRNSFERIAGRVLPKLEELGAVAAKASGSTAERRLTRSTSTRILDDVERSARKCFDADGARKAEGYREEPQRPLELE